MRGALADRLLSAIQALSFARDLRSVMDVVRHVAREASGADGVAFVLRDGDLCYYAEENAIAPLWKGRRFPMTACISGWVMLHGQPAVVEDIYDDPRIPVDAYRTTFVKSLAMVPVRARQPVAAIGAYWAQRHQATADEVEALQALADAASLALTNVELYENLQAAVVREQEARRQAEAANRAKDEWISLLSHELRTPLTPILGWTQMLRRGQVSPAQHARAFEVIERSVRGELQIVEELLDVSRILAGTLSVDRAVVDLRDPVRIAAEALRPTASGKDIRLGLALADAPCPIVGDARRLEQIAWHLVSNALKFTPPGGSVSVRLERTAEGARLTVTDTGQGILPDVLPRLFARFEQADSSTTRSCGGLGLGLSIVRHVVTLHGGTVSAESAGRGRGATFVVTLPLLDAPAPNHGVARARLDQGRLDGVRLLVVDDDPDSLEVLACALENFGARVRTASTAAAALTALRTEVVDAVVSDLAMPEMDGYALLRALRASTGEDARVPAIAVTAYAGDEYQARARAAGFDRYVPKPVDPEALAAEILAARQARTASA